MTTQPPIQQDMFISPGVMSPIWAKFFTSLGDLITQGGDSITVIEEILSEGSQDVADELAALTVNLNSISTTNSVSTATSVAEEESILTLYWMGV